MKDVDIAMERYGQPSIVNNSNASTETDWLDNQFAPRLCFIGNPVIHLLPQ